MQPNNTQQSTNAADTHGSMRPRYNAVPLQNHIRFGGVLRYAENKDRRRVYVSFTGTQPEKRVAGTTLDASPSSVRQPAVTKRVTRACQEFYTGRRVTSNCLLPAGWPCVQLKPPAGGRRSSLRRRHPRGPAENHAARIHPSSRGCASL